MKGKSAKTGGFLVAKRAFLAGVLSLSLLGGCKTLYLPSTNTETIVNLKDSTILHIIDSVRITEASRYKDWAGLLDTLTLKTEDGSVLSRSFCDTTRNILAGELEVKPRQDKTRIIYKDRVVYKDSVRVEEKIKYVDRPVIEYKTPKWAWWSLIFSILTLIGLGLWLYFKLKTGGLFSKIGLTFKNIFKIFKK